MPLYLIREHSIPGPMSTVAASSFSEFEVEAVTARQAARGDVSRAAGSLAEAARRQVPLNPNVYRARSRPVRAGRRHRARLGFSGYDLGEPLGEPLDWVQFTAQTRDFIPRPRIR